jgi:serine O-acetyltransferase
VNFVFKRMAEDIKAVMERDPAARNWIEIFFLYPGVKAIRMHRRAHWFYKHNMKFIARAISQRAVRKTGIEIHPGATIGRRLVIDHGMGVVIGETAEIGDDCLIYQGVTLGGTGKDVGKRHPTIGNNVMISSGAKVLGPFKVGDNSRIASGAIVLEEVPPDCTAAGVPARIVRRAGAKVAPLDQVHIPDPVAEQLCRLDCRVRQLESALNEVAPNKLKELPPLDINCPSCNK